MNRNFGNLFGLAFTWGIWFWLASWTLSPADSLIVAAVSLLLLVPLVLAEGWLLKRRQMKQAGWAASLANFLILVFLGWAILEAIQLGLASTVWPVPLPPGVGLGLLFISGLIFLLLILNLTLKALKAPSAISIIRLVFADWVCVCNRDPILLSLLAFLIGAGLWMQSKFFLVCLLVVISPAFLVFLSQVEESELKAGHAS